MENRNGFYSMIGRFTEHVTASINESLVGTINEAGTAIIDDKLTTATTFNFKFSFENVDVELEIRADGDEGDAMINYIVKKKGEEIPAVNETATMTGLYSAVIE